MRVFKKLVGDGCIVKALQEAVMRSKRTPYPACSLSSEWIDFIDAVVKTHPSMTDMQNGRTARQGFTASDRGFPSLKDIQKTLLRLLSQVSTHFSAF